MTESIEIQILRKISKARGGTLFFVDSFASIGNPRAVNKSLERLVVSGKLFRMAIGMYVRPIKDEVVRKTRTTQNRVTLSQTFIKHK